ncbi:unnamed protein product [Acanthoscelides obtectus]|uniref:Uncharacterized protein n=1 Tax=Acanthoscelides obtectus TaxID=200917 RepID=A0A9P0KM82_ACAOB|nr:unnamed protein product [Acanthoscelides obtectus]CAK1665198.1 hypothetical protein AOBTE_LOCUS24706 [Acanthoscelides obtectus]
MGVTLTSKTDELLEKLNKIRNCQTILNEEISVLNSRKYCLIQVKPSKNVAK